MEENTNKKPEKETDDLNEKYGKEPSEDQIIDATIADALFDIEMGGITHTDPNLSPEMREAFMNQVRAFEEQMKNIEPVAIRELIGDPAVPAAEEVIPDGPVAIRRETERLLTRVQDAGFSLSRPERMTEDGTWYRFLTEMLLEHEVLPFTYPEGVAKTIQHIDFDEIIGASFGPGMIAAEAFLVSLLVLDEPFNEELLADYVQLGGKSVPKQEVLAYIEKWRKQFLSLAPLNFGKLEDAPQLPPVEGSDAMPQLFGVAYEVTYPDGSTELFDGPGVCLLLQDVNSEELMVVGASFPGFEL